MTENSITTQVNITFNTNEKTFDAEEITSTEAEKNTKDLERQLKLNEKIIKNRAELVKDNRGKTKYIYQNFEFLKKDVQFMNVIKKRKIMETDVTVS